MLVELKVGNPAKQYFCFMNIVYRKLRYLYRRTGVSLIYLCRSQELDYWTQSSDRIAKISVEFAKSSPSADTIVSVS